MVQSTQQPENATLRRTLSFYSPPLDGSDPEYIEGIGEEPGRRNYPNREESVLIRDMRDHHKSFTLDEHSFTVLPGVFDLNIDFTEPMEITERYMPWVDDLLRRTIPRVARVTMFNYTMRKACKTKTPIRQVHKVHIDQSPKGAFLRARRHLPAEDITAIENGKAHFRIINVWKPIFRPVKDYPITAAEFRSLRAADLVPVRQVSSDYVGETYVAKYRDGQRFWYWSDMTPDDVFLIQCFDSEEQSVESVALGGLRHAQCAHGSFRLADDVDESCTRESIEVRCLVVIA